MNATGRPTFAAFAVVALMVLRSSGANAGKRLSLRSPDGSLTAVVKAVDRAGVDGVGESAVEIRKRAGDVLTRRDYSSKDGEHGYVVAQAEWSADSAYFVYVTQSSGGHQPWHSPAYVWSRSDNAVYDVADCLAPVAEPSFSLKAPDVVTLSLNTPRPGGGFAGSLAVTFRLGDLVKACKEQ
jgi:hypothetical protein